MAKAKETPEGNKPEDRRQGLARASQIGYSSPFGFMRRFSEEMDRLFEDFGAGHGSLSSRSGFSFGRGAWWPQVEVFEKNGQVVVRADLPGMKSEDVDVEVQDNVLTIQGERKHEHEEEEGGHFRSERAYGSFYRTLPLPEGVDSETAKATFRDGVLEVTMKATDRPRGRRVQIAPSNSPEK